MKIGILTYHKAINYGAELQAIALRYALEKLGYDAFFYDYYPDYHRKMYSNPRLCKQNILSSPLKNSKHILRTHAYFYRRWIFERFQKRYLNQYCKPLTEVCDIAVYGSDQIWRKQPFIGVFNPMYFGNNDLRARVHASYAASIDKLPSDVDLPHFFKLVSHLNLVSVREDNMYRLLQDNGIECRQDLDPTLLLEMQDWENIFPLENEYKHPYVLYFCLNKEYIDINIVREFANKKGCKLKILYGMPKLFQTSEKFYDKSPDEFLRLIRNADFVFTTSYHGMIFSLIFNKQFIVSTPISTGRITSILGELGISDHYVPNFEAIPELRDIDYSLVNEKMKKLRQGSLSYLASFKNIKK